VTPREPHNPSEAPGRLQGRQVDLILRQLESMPTLPEVATRLLKLTVSNQAETQEIINLIRADQSVTARILSLAGKVESGVRKEARTVAKAVVLMGHEAVRSAVLSIKVFEMFAQEAPLTAGLDRREFWRHCLAVACASEMLCRRLRLAIDPEELFICGLLHDLGKLGLEQCLPKSYARVVQISNSQCGNIAEYEGRIIGVDHTVAGRRLAQQWDLPELVEQCIWLHHQPIEGLPAMLQNRRAIAVVHLADTIAREQRFGYSGNFTFPADSIKLATQIGLTAAGLADTIDQLPGVIEHRSRSLGIGEATTEGLYRSALASANLELGRLNRRLRRRAAQTVAQMRTFLLLRQFGASLTGREGTPELCRLLTRTWAGAGEITPSGEAPVAAYVICSGDRSVILAVDAGLEDVEMHVLAGGDESPGLSPPSPATPASEVMERLVSDIQAVPDAIGRLPLAHYPLVCGGRWVGGMLWSAGAAKAQLADETAEALAVAMAFAVALVEGRDRASAMAEQLAQASQQLYAAQKALTEARALAAVGEMAAGAAHEINNPLAVIAGRAQLMAESAAESDRQTWKIMAEQAQKISDVVTEMMEFARPPEPKCDRTGVQALLDGAVAQVRQHKETSDLKVESRVEPGTPELFVDIEQMTSALVELMTNARAACKADPRVSIDAAPDETTGHVLLRIADNGAGMDAETLKNAFTPFYSSRAAGRRRGMGLSKVRRWLQLAGGSIRLVSEAGKGTTVLVQLPPAEDAAGTNKAGAVA